MMSSSSSSNTSQSQIDFGRYKRAKKSPQVVQTPVPIQPEEPSFNPVNTQPINIDEFHLNLPQKNKESDSETETEIWSFDHAINEVFRLLPAELCPKTQQDQAPSKPLSGIEHLMESRSNPLLVLPQSKLVENATRYIQNRLDLDKCFRDWICPLNLVSALAPTKFYKLPLPSSKKEGKVTFDHRPFFIEPIHKETVFQNGDSQVSKTSDETQRLGCLHKCNRCIPTHSDTSSIQEVSLFRLRRSGLSLQGLTIRNVSKSVDIFETGRYSSVSTPTCHISLPIPRRLADQKSDSQPFDYSDKILHSNYSKSRFSAKSKEIGSLPFSEIHLYRHGISDETKFSQGSNGSCTESTSYNQEISVIQTCIGTNFPFSFGQTQCFSRLRSPRQTSLTSSTDVSFVCLETSYSSSRSSNYDKRYDSISLTVVDKPQSIRDRDYYPSSRSQIFPLY